MSVSALRAGVRAYYGHVREGLQHYAQRNRALLWPLVPMLLLCLSSAPLLGAWMRWVELPGVVREQALQPCAAEVSAAPTALDAAEAALAPRACLAGRVTKAPNGLRTGIYRFDDGSLFTLHLPPSVPGRPAPRPILAATCPVQSRQSLLVLVGLLAVGVVVILHRLRAGGKFFDFRSAVREPLLPGEVLLLIYAFTLIFGTAIGLQFGGCAAAEHRDAARVEQVQTSLRGLAVPARR